MSLDVLKAARKTQAALVKDANVRAFEARRAFDYADKVAVGHESVLAQIDEAITSFAAQEALSVSKETIVVPFRELLK